MKITNKLKENLKRNWKDYGNCSSCGWHSTFYEVEKSLIEQLENDDFELDKTNNEKFIVEYCKYAAQQGENHKDIKIYLKDILI